MKVLISKCLLGINCKYNGKNNYKKEIKTKLFGIEFIGICPEVEGGLSIPREPSEQVKDKVITVSGKDVTKFFYKGAEIALKKAKIENIKYAILKSKSPSCGNKYVYDGTFSNKLIKKDGITCKILKENGIIIFDENDLDRFEKNFKKSLT
ncbi:MAG: DUF523 domain-containing protein [Peptoniphilaceae bacterium]|nr:DUF523 domain-containing protein [Peptoniphilaceae bacterium]MDD7383164.1 DUF523 domain-containing protein [Peptoniphilaceae bacterium]MDY3738388.1 DUF523 domain-containing protein [Peptoniphilaceae bacterium]